MNVKDGNDTYSSLDLSSERVVGSNQLVMFLWKTCIWELGVIYLTVCFTMKPCCEGNMVETVTSTLASQDRLQPLRYAHCKNSQLHQAR